MREFGYKLYKGNVFKELVKTLFEESGYDAIPYGYETQFSSLKRDLCTQNSATALRIRSSPDLLIYDRQNGDIRLVEVKMSKGETININKIKDYQEYWKDALIVAVVNFGNVFYAEEIRNLGVKGYYSPKSDFRPIQELFPNIDKEHLEECQIIARKMIKATDYRRDTEELNDSNQGLKQ